MRRLTIDLQDDVASALSVLAQREERDTRRQAALVIRHELERRGLLTDGASAVDAACCRPRRPPVEDEVIRRACRYIELVVRARIQSMESYAVDQGVSRETENCAELAQTLLEQAVRAYNAQEKPATRVPAALSAPEPSAELVAQPSELRLLKSLLNAVLLAPPSWWRAEGGYGKGIYEKMHIAVADALAALDAAEGKGR